MTHKEAINDLKAIKEFFEQESGAYPVSLEYAIKVLKNKPSAYRSKGEWIRDRYWSRGVGMGEDYGFFYKCSLCEYEVENGYTKCGFNFCPNCGARMKGADDE